MRLRCKIWIGQQFYQNQNLNAALYKIKSKKCEYYNTIFIWFTKEIKEAFTEEGLGIGSYKI